MKTTWSTSVPVAPLLCSVALPACALQQDLPSPPARPGTPYSSAPPASQQDREAERQLWAMHEIQQRMRNARTPQARRALLGEHSRVMRQAMEAMERMHRMGIGHGAKLPGRPMHRQMAMMQMMMDRIDMLDPPR